MMRPQRLPRFWMALALCATAVACAKLNLGGTGPLPTPTSSVGPTPGVCGTPAVVSNLVVVAMGNNISPLETQKYGIINGYAVVENYVFPGQAMVINQWLNQGVVQPITTQNILQFANVDTGSALHSAVGFKGHGFPPVPYTFPSAAASPTATAITSGTLWSTGRIDPPTYQQCYSQAFTLKSGIYYFGDLDYYNLSNFRDVLIVGTPTPGALYPLSNRR